MTIVTTQSRITYAGDNVSTLFPIPFEFFLGSDITAVRTAIGGIATTLVLGIDYTLAGIGVIGGGSALLGGPLLSGQTLVLFLNPPITQQSHYISNSPFPSGTLENDIDRQAQISQRLQDQISRAIRAPDGDAAPAMLLPPAVTRASSYLFCDIAGNIAASPILPTTLNPVFQVDDVRIFGAKLDGVTDDTAAVAATLALLNQAYVPYTAAGIVLKNLTVTGTLYSRGHQMQMFAATGALYAVKVAGYGAKLSGFNCQDPGNTTSQTTTSGGASAGAASIAVTSAAQGPGINVGQRIAIELATGFWHATFVTTVVGTTIGLYSPIPTGATVNSGARVWASFGFIYVTLNAGVTTQMCTVENIRFSNCWAGILIDAPTNNGQIVQCTFQNIKWPGTGRMFMIVNGRNANNNDFDNAGGFAGFTTSFAATGNGVTTQYSFPDNVFLTREATITLNGVTKVLGTDYTWLAGVYRTIVFAAAPGNGVAVAGTAWTYGVEGIAEDKVPNGSNVQPQGGNDWTDCSALSCQRGWNFRNAQLFSLSDCISDTCSEAAFCFDACTNGANGLTGLFVGWAATGVKLINGSLLKVQTDVWGMMGAGQQVLNSGAGGVSGLAENVMTVDATSVLDFAKATTLFSTSLTAIAASTTVYLGPNGSQAVQGASQWCTPYQATMLKMSCDATVAPGPGQSYTYTLLDAQNNVLATAVMSGTLFNSTVYIPVQSTNRDGALSVKLVTTAGVPGTAFHRIAVMME